jgi:hypothetical protein
MEFHKKGLADAGFLGFIESDALRGAKLSQVPSQPGVYIVLRDSVEPPAFAESSCGGHFKDKNPTVERSVLERNWVDGATVVYIGKAGGGTSSATLRERLTALLRFGEGKAVGHWGGRLIWQLGDCHRLLFCWRPSVTEDAFQVERALIQEFTSKYGAMPFANLL